MDNQDSEFKIKINQLKLLLNKELKCMQLMMQFEQEKRKSILGIRAENIRKSCASQEVLQTDLASLATEKNQLLSQLLPNQEINLTNLLNTFEMNNLETQKWSEFIATYRSIATDLQKAVQENAVLLNETNDSVVRVMQNVRHSMTQDLEPGYSPDGKNRSHSTSSVFINANA